VFPSEGLTFILAGPLSRPAFFFSEMMLSGEGDPDCPPRAEIGYAVAPLANARTIPTARRAHRRRGISSYQI
jgi:hypothetical protein